MHWRAGVVGSSVAFGPIPCSVIPAVRISARMGLETPACSRCGALQAFGPALRRPKRRALRRIERLRVAPLLVPQLSEDVGDRPWAVA